ncbi:alpha/beta hydrolase [Agromyces silvae]|uniref:alpha/beta hydrolase n=1 Tax=Agromyces silvae TaxID=3388266 RepID=UPI00280B279B|nr:dienelactone hydrolase family protein [Agromyces protaetiae]
MRIDDDAVIWSAAPADREGRPLLVLLHGFNSHEGDLFGLSPYLPLRPVIASLRAPLSASAGYAWFPFMADGMQAALDAADASTTAVLDWLDRAAPAAPSVGVLGFSQGGAMTIELLRRDPARIAFAASLAGFVLPGERDGDAELARARPPVFWGRGTDDAVIPAEAVARTQAWLPEHADVDARIYEGLGHSLSERELGDLVAWLTARYA